eukprot:CAMPEP_0170409126 /NCGR_PEP_ID=MMETSP0117_2-20130122/29169_1 /TAXON_ID=400756 /ORGANISM="Durinskia baltica, Strain CSIRO CS-38" /LENGTH=245 /DNA_ID=CAMNT_0010666529 /DNA_START=327 /DNA_END=1061 /DNA_ORIENTATION=-
MCEEVGGRAEITVYSHFLLLEILIKTVQAGLYADEMYPILTRDEVLVCAKASESYMKTIQRDTFHGNHVAHVPAGSDILSLSLPICTASTPIHDTWTFEVSSNDTITEYGYSLYVGIVISLRTHISMARLFIALGSMNDAKIHLRSALDLYGRYLKSIQGRGFPIDTSYSTRIPRLFYMQLVVGSLQAAREDPHSLPSQITRHHQIVMDVLAEYYFRGRSYADVLNSLCSSVSVHPLPLYSVLST